MAKLGVWVGTAWSGLRLGGVTLLAEGSVAATQHSTSGLVDATYQDLRIQELGVCGNMGVVKEGHGGHTLSVGNISDFLRKEVSF